MWPLSKEMATHSSVLAWRIPGTEEPGGLQSMVSRLTLCDPMGCSLPGSSIHGILQARILEWVATPSPGNLASPGIECRCPALQADSLPS